MQPPLGGESIYPHPSTAYLDRTFTYSNFKPIRWRETVSRRRVMIEWIFRSLGECEGVAALHKVVCCCNSV